MRVKIGKLWKEGKHIFFIRDLLENIMAQLKVAWEPKMFTMPRSWNVDESRRKHGTFKSKARAVTLFLSKMAFECAGEHVMKCASPLVV